ncbi:MAG TPA: guanylate kinase [Fimbriimonadaceae bacterium]|nr:guanylate kinase [Fimbriimonadaceae bacterium]
MAGRLVILSGPSGVGKDTLLTAWSARNPVICRVVAYTTRPMRDHEVDGADYHFVSIDRFREMIAAGAFLEHKEFSGNYYGTPLLGMEALLQQGKVAVLKIDVQGALTVMPLRPDALTIFVMPPCFEELERRIRSRAADSPEVIERRLQIARKEIAEASAYEHVIVNRDVAESVDSLQSLLSSS